MTGHLRLVLGDQLTRQGAALRDPDKAQDVVLMAEVFEEASYTPHHKQKLAFLFSAMRHFAESLRDEGVQVDYIALDDPANTHSLTDELERALGRHGKRPLVVCEPGEWRVMEMMRFWQKRLGVPVDIRDDDRFFCSRADFERLNRARKTGRMEYFYREMRRRTGLLMEGAEPLGGQWNYDRDNRNALPADHRPPQRHRFKPDAITREVIKLVGDQFPDNFGDLEPFGWAVTRQDALAALDHFIADCLPGFGDYQDAMKTGEDFLYHAVLSPYLNCGLLTAREVCDRAVAAHDAGAAPLNAVEGFVRQILGWREFVRGIYWAEMPAYRDSNHLNARRALPALYWTGETDMNCMRECIRGTRQHAYAHHIQRLMVTGNFALLYGVEPAQIEDWYLAVYADAYEWVELPNTHGMVMHADGGRLGSKPYAAGGNYISKMSDYCQGCAYSPKLKTGPKACPFTYLYWNFLIENEEKLSGNPRLAMPYRSLKKMSDERRETIQSDARRFRESLGG